MIQLAEIHTRLGSVLPVQRAGRVLKVAQGRIEATGPVSAIGEICSVSTATSHAYSSGFVFAEIVAINEDRVVLSPLDPTAPILPGAEVIARPERTLAPVGDAFAGRAVDAFGEALDGMPSPLPEHHTWLGGDVMSPLARQEPGRILETGIRAMDGLLPISEGQRVGVFAASGVGKTTLIRQLATQIACDNCILCLVGERGREVESIWGDVSSLPGNFTCIAATSDQSAATRARAVYQALALAEHWRAKKRHVLLIVDSITRFAMALRELGLAGGAPPTLRAYTPNVFAALPRVVERCGAQKTGGAITAVITVLAETDDVDDPIAEVMKSLLDGHIVLSRQLAERGHFPAIDVLRSVSRQSEKLMSPQHAATARAAVAFLSHYEESRLMIETGLYKSGANPRVDAAIRGRERVENFLRQRSAERAGLADTLSGLGAAVGSGGAIA
jgi:flagellum-specific ATP synthase